MSDVEQRLDDLVLLRAATAGKRPPSAADIADATARFAPGGDATAWRTRVAAAHARLVARGALGAGGAPSMTAASAAWARLGTDPVPWAQLADRILPALALGIAPDDARATGRLADRDAWAAAITARAAGLWRGDGPPPSLADLCDAVVWQKLGLAGKAKRSPPEIRAHFVMQLFATPPAPGPPDRLVRQNAAIAVGAMRADLRVLCDALVRRWLAGTAWGTNGARPAIGAPAPAPAPALASAAAGDALVRLAAAVRAAAAAEATAVFDERNVFISAVWRALRGRPPVDGLDLDGFKRALVAAHRAGLVSLARADLVAVMDPSEVAASETGSADARYHFVVREAAREN
jgi:hypothetical protein